MLLALAVFYMTQFMSLLTQVHAVLA